MSFQSIRACALALLAAVAACACTGPDAAEPSLRVYEVPPGRTEALGMALNDVFLGTDDKAPVGKASSRIPGQLLVLAPEPLHASIDETLGQLVADVAEGGDAANAQLLFWVLDAVPGSTDDSSAVPQPVLAALQRQFPGHAFRLYDRARLGIAGQNGNAHLQTAKQTGIRVSVWKEGNGLLGEIEIVTRNAAGPAPLQTTIALPMDEYVVLAVTGPAEGETSAPQRVFVVQATSS